MALHYFSKSEDTLDKEKENRYTKSSHTCTAIAVIMVVLTLILGISESTFFKTPISEEITETVSISNIEWTSKSRILSDKEYYTTISYTDSDDVWATVECNNVKIILDDNLNNNLKNATKVTKIKKEIFSFTIFMTHPEYEYKFSQ